MHPSWKTLLASALFLSWRSAAAQTPVVFRDTSAFAQTSFVTHGGVGNPDKTTVSENSVAHTGSGTTWVPTAAIIPGQHYETHAWSLILHGFAFAQYDVQGSSRGSRQLNGLSWGMLMASHELAGGSLQQRTMLSMDAATVRNGGYPLLLQSGETYRGRPLHDRQHPHDFFMETGATYDRPLTNQVAFSLYGALSGEPALGPTAFMQRASAMDNPFTPIGHHWQDAPHTSFGVVTAGVFTRRWKMETSIFNGREPDESRWNMEAIRLDSYSGRISFTPNDHLAFSTGLGLVKSANMDSSEKFVRRVTASAMHGTAFGSQGQWATTVVIGATSTARPEISKSALLESEVIADDKNTFLGRAEMVQKNATQLMLPKEVSIRYPGKQFGVGSISAGIVREIHSAGNATFGLGLLGAVSFVPQSLESAYGSRSLLGGTVFLRVRPKLSRLSHLEMPGMRM